MEINITKQKRLRQIQAEFQKHFPFLKLEFYSITPKQDGGADKRNSLNNELMIGEVCKLLDKDDTITINETMKVFELEKAFKDILGLSVQVFRKSNNLWLQTTTTDSWTLSKQNQNAIEMNIQEKADEPEDYQERD